MPPASSHNPVILTSKTVFLQRIQEAVSVGYKYCIFGKIYPDKIKNIVRKFCELYLVHIDKNARYRRKHDGLGCAKLILRLNEDLEIDFALLVTPGEHPAHQLEKLVDVRKKTLVYKEFELVLLTLKGRDKPGMTWRLTNITMEAWRQRLHLYTVRFNKVEICRAWHSLYRIPGFAGVRRQVGELVSYWRREWKSHQRDAACPIVYPHDDFNFRQRPGVILDSNEKMYWTTYGFPSSAQLPTLFYVRKQKDVGTSLRIMLRNLQKNSNHHNVLRVSYSSRHSCALVPKSNKASSV